MCLRLTNQKTAQIRIRERPSLDTSRDVTRQRREAELLRSAQDLHIPAASCWGTEQTTRRARVGGASGRSLWVPTRRLSQAGVVVLRRELVGVMEKHSPNQPTKVSDQLTNSLE